MTIDPEIKLLVTPLLDREIGPSPSMRAVEDWRRRADLPADPSTVAGALSSKFEGLSVEHRGVKATLRWLGSTVYAGEKGVFVLLELSTDNARAAVLELERGYDRVLGVPVSSDATERIQSALRDTIELCCADRPPHEVEFMGIVAEFLRPLPQRLAATAPAESLGSWLLEQGISELLGQVCDLPLTRGQRFSVHVRKDESAFQPAKDGVWFMPIVEARCTGARGKRLAGTEQQISIGLIGTDTMYEPLPDAARCKAALTVLRRWKTTLARRLARLPGADVRSLLPMDLPWPTSPIELAVQTLRRDPKSAKPDLP